MAKRKYKGATVYLNDGFIKYQIQSLVDRMELAEEDATKAITKIVQKNADIIQNEINEELERHKLTGETLEHAIKPQAKVEEIGTSKVISANVGVTLSENLEDMKHGNGGYASLMLDYGTPKKRGQKNPKRKYKHHPAEPVQHRFIGSAVRRGRKKAEEETRNTFKEIIKEYLQ